MLDGGFPEHYFALRKQPCQTNCHNFPVFCQHFWHLRNDEVGQNLCPKTAVKPVRSVYMQNRNNVPRLHFLDSLCHEVWCQTVDIDGHGEKEEVNKEVSVFISLARLHPCEKGHDDGAEVLLQVRATAN